MSGIILQVREAGSAGAWTTLSLDENGCADVSSLTNGTEYERRLVTEDQTPSPKVYYSDTYTHVTTFGVYSANGIAPAMVFDPVAQVYGQWDGSKIVTCTQEDIQEYSTTTPQVITDENGVLKWKAHNLALNSASPATQNITVVSGASYTVEMTGSGSITLSGAGTGTVTAGSPVEVTASTTTLTLTVSGSVDTMWAYRSDLGGMVNSHISGTSYVPTAGAAVVEDTPGHHVYEGGEWVNVGQTLRQDAGTNRLLNSESLSTQNVTVTNEPHTLHFTGSGTVTLSGASTAGPLVGTGSGEGNRVSLTFTPTAGTLTLTVSGTVENAQLETGSIQSAYIPTYGATVSRAAETRTFKHEALPLGEQTILMKGRLTYADEESAIQAEIWTRSPDSNNENWLRLGSIGNGNTTFRMENEGANEMLFAPPLDEGVNKSFGTAVFLADTPNDVELAVNGASSNPDSSPGLADLTGVDLDLGGRGQVGASRMVIWPGDIGQTAREEQSS